MQPVAAKDKLLKPCSLGWTERRWRIKSKVSEDGEMLISPMVWPIDIG